MIIIILDMDFSKIVMHIMILLRILIQNIYLNMHTIVRVSYICIESLNLSLLPLEYHIREYAINYEILNQYYDQQ